MAYSTPNDVRNVLAPGVWPVPTGDPTPKTGTAADLSDDQLVEAIKRGDILIDSYIGGRYVTPVAVDPIPDGLVQWSASAGAYYATLTYRRGKDISDQDPVVRQFALLMQVLQRISTGTLTLPIPENGGSSASAGAGVPVNSYSGDLFGSSDFNLVPINSAWPYYPDIPPPFPGLWVGR
jgi:phage gp36-like protein